MFSGVEDKWTRPKGLVNYPIPLTVSTDIY